MPSVLCEHCRATIQNSRNLSRHQLTKACLETQRRSGLDPKIVMFTCNCGFESAIRDELKIHQQKCDRISREIPIEHPVPAIHTIPITLVNNAQSNHVSSGDEMVDLFIQRIKSKSSVECLCELCKEDYEVLLDQIIFDSIKNEQGESDIRIADRSRQKLMIRNSSGNIEDVGANKTKAWIGAVVDEMLFLAYRKGTDLEKILRVMRDSKNDQNAGYPILQKHIFTICPRKFHEQIQPKIWTPNRVSPLNSIMELTKNEMDQKEIDHNGFIYLLRTREFKNTKEPVFKFGKTRSPNASDRINSYPKGSEVYYIERVKDCDQLEKDILAKMRISFKQRTDLGSEYFEGNIEDIIDLIRLYFRC